MKKERTGNAACSARVSDGSLGGGDGFVATLRVGWNMRPQANASLTSDVEVTPVLSSDRTLTANVTGGGATITASSSDGGRDFLNLSIDIKHPTTQGTWEGHLKIAYEDAGSGTAELEVVSGTASTRSTTAPTVPPTGSTAQTPDSPASGFLKFDWDGNGFNRFEIRTKTDEQWNPVYTDSEGSMTEENINKHDFKLILGGTYESDGSTESTLTASGDLQVTGTGSASETRFVDYASKERILHKKHRLYAQPAPMIGELRIEPDRDRRIEPDRDRQATYTKTIASSASFDASRDPQLVINPPTVSGSSRVSVTGYHKVHVYPFHHDPSMDYHEGVDMDLADGSGTNYGDSYWNQTWPITVDPDYDPRNDFEKSLQAAVDAAVLELTDGSGAGGSTGGSCSGASKSGGSAGALFGEGEEPLDKCEGKPVPAYALRFLLLDKHQRKAPVETIQENMTNAVNAVETSASLLPGGGLATTSLHLGTGQNLDGSEVTPTQATFEIASAALPFLPILSEAFHSVKLLGAARALSDCEKATQLLRSAYKGSRPAAVGFTGFDHHFLRLTDGTILDVTIKLRNAESKLLSESVLKANGLDVVIESGVFTAEQHNKLLSLIQESLRKRSRL